MKGINFIKTSNYRWLLMVVMMVCCVNAWGVPNFNTAEQCYEIATAADLTWVKNNYASNTLKAKSFKLTANIKVSDNRGHTTDFIGIGTSGAPFDGVFDGNNFTITFNQSNIDETKGLFCYTNGATIKNLHLEGTATMKTDRVTVFGSVVGNCKNTIINNVTSHFTINANSAKEGSYIGGIVGYMENSQILNCLFNGSIQTKNTSNITYGGICAVAKSGTIKSCDFKGRIEDKIIGQSGVKIGGILGGTTPDADNLTIDGNSSVGGSISFDGKQDDNNNSYGLIAGNISGTNINVENNSYTPSNNAQGEKDPYGGFNGGSSSTPGSGITEFGTNVAISTVDDFNNFVALVNGRQLESTVYNAYLVNDITFSSIKTLNASVGTADKPFNGTFDGKGFAIKNININSSNMVEGLFKYVNGATIQNVLINGKITVNSNKEGNIYVGLIGEAKGACNVNQVVSDLNIYAKTYHNGDCNVGGLIGNSKEINVKNSLFLGKIDGNTEWSGSITCGSFIGKMSEGQYSICDSYVNDKSQFVGWKCKAYVGSGSAQKIENNYLYSLSGGLDGQGASVSANISEISDGALCTKLNNGQPFDIWILSHGRADYSGIALPFGKPMVPKPVSKISLTFGQEIPGQYNFSDCSSYIADEMELAYTVNDNNWHPFYIPLRLTYDSWKDQFEVAKIMNFHDYTKGAGDDERRYVVLEVQRITRGTLKENHPYVFRVKNPSSSAQKLSIGNTFPEQSRTLYKLKDGNSISCATTENIYTFTGNYSSRLEIRNNDYILNGSALDMGAMLNGSTSIGPGEWYMRVTSRNTVDGDKEYYAPKRIFISIDGFDAEASAKEGDDFATGIDNTLENSKATEIVYYSKNGIKFSEPQAGLNIVKMSDGSVKKIWVK